MTIMAPSGSVSPIFSPVSDVVPFSYAEAFTYLEIQRDLRIHLSNLEAAHNTLTANLRTAEAGLEEVVVATLAELDAAYTAVQDALAGSVAAQAAAAAASAATATTKATQADAAATATATAAAAAATSAAAAVAAAAAIPVSVKAFGALGNGAHDDTAAIQAAINALPLNTASTGILSPLGFANGGSVFLPKGRYRITSPIVLRRGVRVYGESRESTQLVSFVTGSVFSYADDGRYVQDEIVFENLSIWQDSSVVSTSGAAIDVFFGTAVPPSTNLICKNLLIMNTFRGIRLAAGIWSSFDNVYIQSCVTNGFEIAYTDGTQNVPTTSTTFKNTYASQCGNAGYKVTGAAYVSFVGTASDSNGTYGYHFEAGNTYSMLSCGAEENTLGGVYLKNVTGVVLNLSIVHTTAGVKHGVIVDACDGILLLGGVYSATTATGYGVHVAATGGRITTIGARFVGNYTTNICDSLTRFLNLTGDNGLTGSSGGKWAIGNDAFPDPVVTFNVGGNTTSEIGLKANGVFSQVASTNRNIAAQVLAQTAATALTYPELYGLHIPAAVKGAGSVVARIGGIVVEAQTAGSSATADIYIANGAAIPVGQWGMYSAVTKDSVFVGPIRSGSGTGPKWSSGTGSPETVVTAPVGSLYSRTDGGAATSLYVKETGTGATGWVAK